MRSHWRSLRARIIAWSFIPTAIIMLAVALATFYAYQRVTEDLVIGRNREVTRLSAGQLAADMDEYTGLLNALTRPASFYEGDAAAQRTALKQASARLVVFDAGVVALNSHGTVVATEPERPEIMGQDWSNRPYYRQMLRSQGPTFSDILPDGAGGAEVIVVAVPITGSQGEFRGTVAGMFRLGAKAVSAYYGGIVRLRMSETGTTYLVDGNGRLIYHTDGDRIGASVSTQPAVQQVLSGKVGYLRTRDAQGHDIVASYAPVPGTTWGLVTEISWATLMSASQGYRLFLIVLLVLGVVGPALVVTVGVRRITGPIARLIVAAQEVAGGRFGQTISVRTGDELEELAKQFNLMSAQLAESYANLEQRVADRTRELATLNAIAGVASRSLDLEEILRDALDKTMEALNVQAGAAYSLDDEGRAMTLRTARGAPPELVREVAHLPLGRGPGIRAARIDRPMVMPVSEYPESQFRQMMTARGLKQVFSAPLVAKGQPIGMFYLATTSDRPVTAEELSLLAAIGQQVGLAMENARLYKQAEQTAAIAERSRLARDLHDAVSQTLFSASLTAEVLPKLWERNPEEGMRRLEKLRQLTRGALAEMRMLLLELRPAALTEAALSDLLHQLCEATTGRARVAVGLSVEGECPHLPPDVQVALYRIAQEALNNVAKHAEASQATVRLRCLPHDPSDGASVELHIEDDGRGFEPGHASGEHLGLGIMIERARAVGAQLTVESHPGKGTQITVVWPTGGGMEKQ